jgi:hypothetical protein
MNLDSPNSISSVDWVQGSQVADKQQPLTWHKVWGTRKGSFTRWFFLVSSLYCLMGLEFIQNLSEVVVNISFELADSF